MSIEIVRVSNRKDLKKFLCLPDEIYKSSPHYIKPLHLHSEMMLDGLDKPNKLVLLALKDNKAVARLAVKIHNHGGEKLIHYGFFECHEGELEAAKALFNEAHQLAPELPIKGPYHFRMEDPYVGNLVKGFDQDPYVFMPYNPPYYDKYLQEIGFTKAIDLYTYFIPVTECPKNIKRISERGARRGVSVRWLDSKNLKNEVKKVASIFNDALSENWGFEPITDDQLDEMFMLFKYFIDHRLVCFTVKDGVEIGCLILLPNLNPIIKTTTGRLTPGFVWRLLTRRKNYDSARGYALGMRKGHEGSGHVCQLIDAMYDQAHEINLKYVEISWVLENNRPMTEMSKSIGGTHNKTYRVYEKPALN